MERLSFSDLSGKESGSFAGARDSHSRTSRLISRTEASLFFLMASAVGFLTFIWCLASSGSHFYLNK